MAHGFIQDELDLKLLILYIMSRAAAPITFLQLLDLALCDAGVDYFSLTQAVGHLVETGHLVLEDGRYAITDKGRRNIGFCEDSLPFSVRRRCDESLAGVNDQLRREAQVRCELFPRPDGTCTVCMALDDESGSLLRLELLTPSQEQAQTLAEQFKDHPEQVYHGVMNALLPGGET